MPSARRMGSCIFTLQLHSRAVTGLKIMKIKSSDKDSEDKTVMVSVGMDRKLIAIDMHRGKVEFSVDLPAAPLCLVCDIFILNINIHYIPFF